MGLGSPVGASTEIRLRCNVLVLEKKDRRGVKDEVHQSVPVLKERGTSIIKEQEEELAGLPKLPTAEYGEAETSFQTAGATTCWLGS